MVLQVQVVQQDLQVYQVHLVLPDQAVLLALQGLVQRRELQVQLVQMVQQVLEDKVQLQELQVHQVQQVLQE